MLLCIVLYCTVRHCTSLYWTCTHIIRAYQYNLRMTSSSDSYAYLHCINLCFRCISCIVRFAFFYDLILSTFMPDPDHHTAKNVNMHLHTHTHTHTHFSNSEDIPLKYLCADVRWSFLLCCGLDPALKCTSDKMRSSFFNSTVMVIIMITRHESFPRPYYLLSAQQLSLKRDRLPSWCHLIYCTSPLSPLFSSPVGCGLSVYTLETLWRCIKEC